VVGQQTNLPEEPNYQWEDARWGTKAEGRGRVTNNLPKQGCGGSLSWSHGTEDSIQNWIARPCWKEFYRQSCRVGQPSCHLVKTKTGWTILPKLVVSYLKYPITTCPVDRRNQILLTSQSSCKTTSELLLVTDSP
jgi:hypothetical protein